MKKVLLDSDELSMAIVANDDGLFYTIAFDNSGGHSIDITRAQAFTLAKVLGGDLIKGIPIGSEYLAPAGPRIPVVTPELAEAHAILDEAENLP